MAIAEWNDGTFDRELAADPGLTVVDFWAPWCGPCRIVAPVLEELAQEYSGKVRFAKVNVDHNPEIAGRYGIRSIPTIGFFVGGQPAGAVVGAYPKAAFKQVIDRFLAKEEAPQA